MARDSPTAARRTVHATAGEAGADSQTRWGQPYAGDSHRGGISLLQVVKELNTYLRGWLDYSRWIETPTIIRNLDSWIRRRLRCYMMKQWIKNSHTRYQRLRSLGVSAQGAGGIAVSRKGPWALSNAKPLKVALSNRIFAEKGLFFPPRSVRTECNDDMNRLVRSRMPGGVRGRRL